MENKCPICYEDLIEKIKASPNVCDHVFCLPCLERWSKQGNFCPIDRKRYRKILNLDSDDVIQVKPRKRKRKRRALYEFSYLCEVCEVDQGSLLICDCCNLCFHLYCLNPPLKKIPDGQWFCPTCSKVEKKLKREKGITKEVEAAINFKKEVSTLAFYNSKSKRQNFENEEVCRNNSIVEAFNNIITEFEDIAVNGNCSKGSTSMLNDSFNKIDKIDKTFHFEVNSSSRKHSKYLKTYEFQGRNKKKKPPTEYQIQETLNNIPKPSDVDDICSKSTTTKDSSLLEQNLFDNVILGFMKPDRCIEESTLQSITSSEKRIDYPSMKRDNLQKKTADESSKEDGMCRSSETVVSKKAEDVLSPGKFSLEASPKGSVNNLNSEFLNFSRFKPGTIEKIHFSVFDKISDTDASQKKYSEINTFIDNVFSSKLHVGDCLSCKGMIFVKSEKYCKICKQKYFKKSVNNKHSRCIKGSRQSSLYDRFRNLHINNSSPVTDYQRSAIKKCSIDVSEKRQRSLLHKLKKIRDSKSNIVVP